MNLLAIFLSAFLILKPVDKPLLSVKHPDQKTGVTTKIPFEGVWGWEKDSDDINFGLTFKKVGNNLVGIYCYAADNATKTDCPEDDKVSFTIPYPTSSSFTIPFSSNNTADKGMVKLSFIGNELFWEVIKKPGAGFLCPLKAKLIKGKLE